MWSYNASKAAANSLTKNLAVTLGSKCVTVNAILPGIYPSKMTKFGISKHGDKMAESHPMGKPAPPRCLSSSKLTLSLLDQVASVHLKISQACCFSCAAVAAHTSAASSSRQTAVLRTPAEGTARSEELRLAAMAHLSGLFHCLCPVCCQEKGDVANVGGFGRLKNGSPEAG